VSEEKNIVPLDADLLASLRVDISGRKLDVIYRASEYTPELLEAGMGFPAALVKLVVDWGLERNGQPVPITLEGLATVPFAIQRAIWNAILEDFDPNLTWATSSSATS
jgi:hypothetical protein